MKINKGHLTYCTNIHPGETWEETFKNLEAYATVVKRKICGNASFGLGLRLSNEASLGLGDEKMMERFKNWLAEENMYVFTLNGFPYGNFHRNAVKDKVHSPDWTTGERLNYTKRLFDILSVLLPENINGGISTSPISYRYWYDPERSLEQAKEIACRNLADLVAHLFSIKEATGKSLHLDIEPEPDGIIETSEEFVDYFENYLLDFGKSRLAKTLGVHPATAEELIRDHIRVCYDVCHFAVEYEEPETALDLFENRGIGIGKVQISAALKAEFSDAAEKNAEIKEHLAQFDEPVYLHQAVLKEKSGKLQRFQDLKPALAQLPDANIAELRTHYHVPIFTDRYQLLQSTNDDIVKTLEYWKNKPFTDHLEVETYTWDVLPESLKLDLTDSIYRELNWVLNILDR